MAGEEEIGHRKMAKRATGEGSIVQRADGRWGAALTTGWIDGKQRRKWIYGKTQQEVKGKLSAARSLQQQGFALPNEKQTLTEYLDYWLENHVKNECRATTLSSYQQLITNHIKPLLGHVRLAKLSPQQVKMWLNDRLNAGLSRRTVQYLHAVVRAALAEATRLELVPRNVALLVKPPSQQHHEIEPLSPEQCADFLQACSEDRLFALFSVAVSLGLREGECFGLRWSDIDFDAGTLSVRYQMQRIEGKPQFVPPKSTKGRRVLPMPAVLMAQLQKHRAAQQQERLLCGSKWQDYDLVFCTPIGTPLDPANVLKKFHSLLKATGLPKRRLHDLRHSCASLLISQGVDLKVIQVILGHSQISITANLYTHIALAVKRDALSKMDAILAPEVVREVVKPAFSKPN
jgi:integrase